jgi:Zn-dependent membrane protease YugP
MYLGFDPLYWMMMIPAFILAAIASFRVKSVFNKYSKRGNHSGLTGKEMAEEILRRHGLSEVQVKLARGFLSDHYDPTKKVVKLSPKVYNSNSIAAIGIAAHETGHAIQHDRAYAPLKLRTLLVPIASIGSNFAWIIIIGGYFMNMFGLVKIGVILFAGVVLFQLITLPVEFNASSRAKAILSNHAMVTSEDIKGVNSVLNAAAMTYVAAAASAILTLLYFLIRLGLLGDD